MKAFETEHGVSEVDDGVFNLDKGASDARRVPFDPISGRGVGCFYPPLGFFLNISQTAWARILKFSDFFAFSPFALYLRHPLS